MPSSGCYLQYAGFLLPSTLNGSIFVQVAREQRAIQTWRIPYRACCPQYAGVWVSSTLKVSSHRWHVINVVDANHAIFSMLLTVRQQLATRDVKGGLVAQVP